VRTTISHERVPNSDCPAHLQTTTQKNATGVEELATAVDHQNHHPILKLPIMLLTLCLCNSCCLLYNAV
jgi:hypothetical protein